MARIRKDVAQRQKIASDYGQKVYKFPEDASSYDDLRKAYLHLADIADRRMRRLEEYASKDKKYANILKFAYDKAINDIEAERGSGANRFKAGALANGNILNMQSRINDVLKFLNSPTSTISGVKKVYGQRAKVINEKYGLDLTWEQMADFFENESVQATIKNFASDTAMKMIGKYYRNKDEIQEIFDKTNNKSDIQAFSSEKTSTKLTAKQMRYLYQQRTKLDDLF